MSPRGSAFSPTRWTLVVQARGRTPEARAALADLCTAYYSPVREFIRQWLHGAERADDLTQDFFAQLLARGGVDGADPERGRFRSFLLGAVKHFLAHVRDRERAARRGGGIEFHPLETSAAALADPALPPDAAFDRQWALTLVCRALAPIEAEFAADGRELTFQTLKPWLTGDAAEPQAAAAAALGLSVTAVKVAFHRLRQRFRRQLRAELASTLDSPAMAEEEMRHLFAALS
jgi:RNA polymerase sigma-70 factor (ECF subfamily)